MTKQFFFSVVEIQVLFCKAVTRWSMSFPHELLLFGPPPKQGNKTPKPNHSAQPISLPEPKQNVHYSFWI